MTIEEKAAALQLLGAVDAIHTTNPEFDYNNPKHIGVYENICWMFSYDGKKIFRADDIIKALDGEDTGSVYRALMLLQAIKDGCLWRFDILQGHDPQAVEKIVDTMYDQIVDTYGINGNGKYWLYLVYILFQARGYDAIAESLELHDLKHDYAPATMLRVPKVD